MIIYADILFFINALITYLCLWVTALIFKIPFKRKRLFISAVLGGVFSFSILLPVSSGWFAPLKLLMCLSLVFVGFGKNRLRTFLVQCLLFGTANCLIGGVVLALSVYDSKDFYSNIAFSYIQVKPLVFIVSLLISYIVILLFTKVIFKRAHRHTVFKVWVLFENKEYLLHGFCDSGNSLSEPFSALPVCLVKSGAVPGLEQAKNQRIIPFSSLAGEGLLKAAKVTVRVSYDKRKPFEQDVYLAQNEAVFEHSPYDIILNEKIFESEPVDYV